MYWMCLWSVIVVLPRSLVFEILWFLMVDWMGLWTVIVVLPRHWYLRFCGSSWCTWCVCELELWHYLVIGIWDSVIPHGVFGVTMICNCGITSSLVFEIMWFLMVDWMGLWSVIVALPRHWYLRLCGSSWCKGCVCEQELCHYLVNLILWFLMVDWMGLWFVIVVLPRYWYLRFCGSSWCNGWVCDL